MFSSKEKVASEQARHFVMFRQGATGYAAGQHVRLVGQVVPDWLRMNATQTSDPFLENPEAIVEANGDQELAEERERAKQAAAQHTPDRILTSQELQRKMPALKDPTNFDLATQHQFPRPIKRMQGFSLVSERGHR
jgi:hypothetical protein